MSVQLFEHQKKALNQLKVGSILRGGTGSGKSITAIAFYFFNICKGQLEENYILPMQEPRDLYIITTAKKRDSLEWDKELAHFLLSRHEENINGVNVVIDSWNNIEKYTSVVGSFFIFDEQRVVGSGSWVKKFLRITKVNKWILLTATPGDTWMDYIPVFVANGFYKNRTEFIRRHVVYNPFVNFPQVKKILETDRLKKLRDSILVEMEFQNDVNIHDQIIFADFNEEQLRFVSQQRFNIYTNEPIKQASEFYSVSRRIVNTHESRQHFTKEIIRTHGRVIIFYNFDYELDILRELCKEMKIAYAEWNGHKHQDIPVRETDWVY